MAKFINGDRLSKHHIVKSISIPVATIGDAKDLVKPHIKRKVTSAVESIKQEHPTVETGLSSVVHQKDDSTLNTKIDKINSDLEKYCQ